MNFIRKIPPKIVQSTQLKVPVSCKRWTDHNPFVKNNLEPPSHRGKWGNLTALSVPLEQYPRYRNEVLIQSTSATSRYTGLKDSNGRKRARDSSDDDHHHDDKKQRLIAAPCRIPRNDNRYEAKRNSDSFHETRHNKRPRDDSMDDDFHEAKKPRLDDNTLVRFAIKQPSQYANPNRKILENLFDSEITAEGWKKRGDVIEYHTEICGSVFYEMGNSIDDAKEHVAATALKQLCNFKHEPICWPEQLLSFRLDQEFADKIERMVKTKFHVLMERQSRYKSHKVLASIVMTNGMSVDNAKVVAIGTGTKCIDNINDDDDGIILHDMHAEVLARRGFVRFVCDQLNAMMNKKSSIFELEGKEIRLKDGLKFHLYVNAIPCGDARIFSLPGLYQLKRESKMGSLRIKKIGGTEPISENSYRIKSLSCSDKIARWNVLGLQGSHLAKFIKPIYLQSIVLGSKYNPIHLYRAIIGRLDNAFLADLPIDYCVNKPYFESTSLIETENIGTPASMDHGICWNDGDVNEPEILNLQTGRTIYGEKSIVSKLSFMKMFKSIDQKLPVRSDDGIATFQKVKEKFYSALKKKDFGAWEKGTNPS